MMREDDGGRKRVKTGWEHGPIYTASHDRQGRPKGAHFGSRARGAKIGRSEEGGEGRSAKWMSET
jgi:hypothetical protein